MTDTQGGMRCVGQGGLIDREQVSLDPGPGAVDGPPQGRPIPRCKADRRFDASQAEQGRESRE